MTRVNSEFRWPCGAAIGMTFAIVLLQVNSALADEPSQQRNWSCVAVQSDSARAFHSRTFVDSAKGRQRLEREWAEHVRSGGYPVSDPTCLDWSSEVEAAGMLGLFRDKLAKAGVAVLDQEWPSPLADGAADAQVLNAAVTAANAAVAERNARAKAGYDAQRAQFEQQLAAQAKAADAARAQYEADQRRYQDERARWQEKVRACAAGDRLRCN